MEQWIKIKDYENYEVSNEGKIRRIIKDGEYRYLKFREDKDGYLIADLSKEGKQKRYRVHRAVAQAFIENPNELPQVNHKDENKKNNCVDNLEWCTNKYNCNYGNRTRKISNSHCNFIILQKDLNGNLVKVWNWDKIYDLTRQYNYQKIRDQIRKGIKPKDYIWERIDLI